jgi:CheY-like chemotaxis protein/DNA-binding XRE family transcriptional regulator
MTKPPLSADTEDKTGGDKQAGIYLHVGNRIRERRKTLGISQTRIAELMGISYQQVQKYETGTNQISLTRLLQFAHILNVAPEHFYEGVSVDGMIGTAVESDLIQKSNRELHVLLVEDNPGDAMLFERALKSSGLRVRFSCLSDTERLLETVGQRQPPDLVILDLNLPRISGLQLLKDMKSNSQIAHIPAVILTNSVSRREMMEAYRLGASGFIQKSMSFEEYKENIDTVMNYWLKVVALPTHDK